MKASMLGILSIRAQLQTDALILINVMGKELAHLMDGAKEHQDHQRMRTTYIMRVWLETNAHQTHRIVTLLTETTTVTETEPAQEADGAKEHPDDLHPNKY